MAGLDTLTITKSGFFNINKKIISTRVFSPSLITIKGKTVIIDGIASSFSSENYLTYSPLSFIDTEKIVANFKGTFTSSDHEQCAWELISSEGGALTLSFDNSRVTLLYEGRSIFSFGNLELTDGMQLSAFLTLRSGNYEFTLNYGKKAIQKSGILGFLIPLNSFIALNIGNSSLNRENAWAGSIDLREFSIYNNGNLLYCPSEGASWNFSYILVSDGKFPMTDTTEPVLDHVFKFPVTEISRSGNSALLTCSIDENSYLTIREIGLYIQTPDGIVLFGYINNLNINKTEGLAYDLIFTVNTTISVMNAIGFPAENGIVVRDPDFVEFKNYTTIQQVNTYVLTNLERMIRMNAGAKGSYSYINSAVEDNQAGIGHNRPQVIYKLQQELESQEDCYNTIDTFTKLTNKFQELYDYQINYDILEAHGGIRIPENGEIVGFSDSKYITSNTAFSNTSNWEAAISFHTKDTTRGSLITLGNSSDIIPLELGIKNNKCHLKIQSLESIEPTNAESFYSRSALNDTKENNINYYGWIRNDDNSSLYNFHIPGLPISTSSVVTFPRAEAALLEHPDFDNMPNFSFSIRVMFTDITGTQYIIGKPYPSSEHSSFEILLENGKLKAYLYDRETGELIDEPLTTKYNLKPNKYYIISLSYENRVYTLQYSTEISQDFTESEMDSMFSLKRISLNPENTLVIGDRYISREVGLVWSVPAKSTALQNETWSSATYGAKFSALSLRGYTATSTDGITWTAGGTILATSQSISILWKAVSYGSNKYIALSENGFISNSSNGTAWAIASQNANLSSNENVTWSALSYGNNKFVALDSNGYISTSTNGTTWANPSQKTNLGERNWASLTYGNGKFVALSPEGYISTSTNGTTWTPAVLNGTGIDKWSAITFADNKFIALTSDGYMSTSEDGTTWSTPSRVEELNLENTQWIALSSNGSKAIALDRSGLASVTPGGYLKGEIDFTETRLGDGTYTWRGAISARTIYSLAPQPLDNTPLYDNEFQELQGSVATNYAYYTITDSDLFTLEQNTKYTVKVSYKEDSITRQGDYKVTYMRNDLEDTTTTAYSKMFPIASNFSNRMGIPTITYIGIEPDLTEPFSSTISLYGSGVVQEYNEWLFGPYVNTNDSTLLQYYRMPDLNKDQYLVRDICNLNRTIRFLGETFESNEDLINTTYEKGLTLSIKANLQDVTPKVLLYKSNLVNDIYLSLTFLDQTLAFSLVTKDGLVTVSKKLNLEEYDAYTREPIMISVILTPQYDNWFYVQMFKNNEPITENKYIQLDRAIDPSMYILSNYIEEMPTYEVTDESGHTIIKTVEPGRYVSDIVVIEGVVNERNLFYMNNLFDTNY